MAWRGRRHGKPDQNQADIVAEVRRVFGLEVDVRITTGVGDDFPDLVIGWRGLTILVEIKRPGKKLLEGQQRFRDKWPGSAVLDAKTGQELVAKMIALDQGTPPLRRTA
jgi:hypothetical protein